MIKKFTFLLFLSALYHTLSAQTTPNDTANYPYWAEMVQDPNENYYKTVRAFDLYWENRPRVPHSGYKAFERWKEFWSHHIDMYGNREPATKNLQAWIDYNGGSLPNGRSVFGGTSGDWIPLGPFGNPTFNTQMIIGNGRINTIAFHPTDSAKLIIGAPQGGAWMTSNGGQAWTPLTDGLPSLGVSTVVWDYSNPNTLLIGTGDRDFGDAPGVGVYKSTDGGSTWAASNTGMPGPLDIYCLAQNPLNPNVLIAGTSNGSFYSSNKGNTWSWTFGGAKFKDIRYKPNDTSVVYITYAGYFYRSADGGQTWTDITSTSGSGLPAGNTVSRYLIGVCKSAPNMVYLVGAYGAVYKGFYVSSDGGLTFRAKSTTPNILGYAEDGSDNGGQAFYDLSMSTRTDSANVIYVGGINIFKSTDTGATWDCIGHWVGSATAAPVHGDQHWMSENPLSKKLYAACDGGIYLLQPNGTWLNRNSNLAISQIYRIGQSPAKAGRVIAGFQDNGTAIRDPNYGANPWNTPISADGMECIQDPKDTSIWYGSMYYGMVLRNGTVSVATGAEPGPWITSYLLHPDSNATMFMGMYNLWRNKKVNTSPIGTWEKLSTGLNVYINEVHICRANPNILYFNKLSKFYRTSTCMGPVSSMVFDTLNPPVANQSILDFETSYTDSNIVYAVLSDNKVYMSTNRGATWTDYGNGLPNSTKYCLQSDKYAKRGLYCGTFNGIYYRDSSMSSWTFFGAGLPVNSAVREIELYYDTASTNNSRVTAGTYGRGLWQSPTYLKNTAPQPAFGVSDTNLCVNKTYQLTDSSTGNPDYWRWTISPGTYTFVNGTNTNSQHPQVQFSAGGKYTVKLYVRKNGYGYNTLVRSNYLNVVTPGTLSVTAAAANVCKGDSVQLIASGGNGVYTWAPSAGLSATTGNKVMAAPSGTTYYYVLSGNATCVDSAGVTVNVLARPLLTSSGNVTVCAGSSAQLSAGGAVLYRWSPSAGLNTDTGKTVIATPASSTTYKITGTNSNGCIDSAFLTVTVLAKPAISTSGNRTICQESKIVISAVGAASYKWSPATGLSADTGASVVASPITTTTYKVVGTSLNGCTDSAFITVTVTPKVVLQTSGNVKICNGSSTVLRATGADNYTWSPSTGLSATTGDSVIANPHFSTRYTIIGTSSGRCSDTDSVYVKVVQVPILGYSHSGGICEGDSDLLTAYGADAYEWSPATGLSATTGSKVYAKPTASTIYSLKGINDSLCTSYMAVNITVYPKPPLLVTPNAAKLAMGQHVTLTASGAKTYSWTPAAGLNTTTGSSVIASPVLTTTYTVTGTSDDQCTDTAKVTVTIAGSGINAAYEKFFSVHPNPNEGVFTLSTKEEGVITLYTIDGKLLFTQKVESGNNAVSLSAYAKGMYILMLSTGSGTSAERIVVK